VRRRERRQRLSAMKVGVTLPRSSLRLPFSRYSASMTAKESSRARRSSNSSLVCSYEWKFFLASAAFALPDIWDYDAAHGRWIAANGGRSFGKLQQAKFRVFAYGRSMDTKQTQTIAARGNRREVLMLGCRFMPRTSRAAAVVQQLKMK